MALNSSDKQKLIFQELREVRKKNKLQYERMRKFFGKPPVATDDPAMDLIEHSYGKNQSVAELMHSDILDNDGVVIKLSRLLKR